MKKKLVITIICVLYFTTFEFVDLRWNETTLHNSSTHDDPYNVISASNDPDPSFVSKVSHEWLNSWNGDVYDLTVDSSDNVYIVGTNLFSNAYLLTYDADGNIKWNKTWGGSSYDSGRAVAVDSTGNIYLAGNTQSFASSGYDMFLVKYDFTGNQLWNTTWENSEYDYVEDIAIDSKDNIIILGKTEIWAVWEYDLVINKYNSTGDLLWSDICGYVESDYPIKVVCDSVDNIYIASRSSITNPGPSFYYILKYSDSGLLLLTKEFLDDSLKDMEIDIGDNIYLLGSFSGNGQSLKKCDNGFTTTIWQTTWIDFENYNLNLAIDKNNNTYVGGGWYSLMKFNQTGLNCWNFTIAEASAEYKAEKIKIDSQGNIYCIFEQNSEAFLIKYDNSTHTITCLKSPKFLLTNFYALLIGCANYPGTDNDLNFPYSDIEDMITHLRKDCNILSNNIIVLYDPTEVEIRSEFTKLESIISENDTFLFYYSGHGGYSSSSSYLCPYDSLPPDPSYHRINESELDLHLNNIDCLKKYVLIDACNSGGFASSYTNSGEFILTSSKKTEFSLESFDFSNGVFTHYFLDSFNNTDDNNNDGFVSIEERFLDVSTNTKAYSSSYGILQSPQLFDGLPYDHSWHPSASMTYGLNDDLLTYNLFIHGSGQIYDIVLKFYSDTRCIVLNLSQSIRGDAGFGKYSGQLEFNSGEEIKYLELTTDLKGEKYMSIKYIFFLDNNDEDDEFLRQSELYDFLLFGMASIAISLCGAIFYIVVKKPWKSFKKDSLTI